MPDHGRSGPGGLYVALVSVHGLIRGRNLELGRDPDTGGQTLYVVELARALARRPEVAAVDLFTRRVVDPGVDADYARPVEELAPGARIVRLDCGPEEYIRKELLWDHLDAFSDNLLAFLREEDRIPDLVHSHYADAGLVGQRVSHQLGIPLVHTGHSLGLVKRRRLLASGMTAPAIEERYNMTRRIGVEEDTLAAARRVIVSSNNEISEQYGLYDFSQPDRMRVVPPGTDLDRFAPPEGGEERTRIARVLSRFLAEPQKPMILAMSRPDERKNISTLVKAFGASSRLQRLANLVIVAGTRDDIREMDDSAGRVLLDLLLEIDAQDLYGRVAYPKYHTSDEVPILYRLAAASGGVFVNPALTEPFGLTLIEAAASGLPVVATEEGGPRDIIANCRNGLLVDPLDPERMVEALLALLEDRAAWQLSARRGLEGVERHYTWAAHAERYLEEIRPILTRSEPRAWPAATPAARAIRYHDRAIVTDLDQTLLGDDEALRAFIAEIGEVRKETAFGIATGRQLESALRAIRKHGIPQPDFLITSVGAQIHYAPDTTVDDAWSRHIDHLWTPRRVRAVLADLPGLELQPADEQHRFKLSYYYDGATAPPVEEITGLLRAEDLTVNLFVSFGQYLDILPVRASKGFALRWFAERWDIPLDHILAAGGSGADEGMLRGNTLAVVVANRHDEELTELTDVDRIYFATRPHAAGILEAIDHYGFLDRRRTEVS